MFFDLLVLKLKNLKSIRISCLGCFGFCKIINYALVGISLFDIVIRKVNNQVAVWVSLSSHTICEHNFLFARLIDALDFTIMTHNLVDHFLVLSRFLMIFVQVL